MIKRGEIPELIDKKYIISSNSTKKLIKLLQEIDAEELNKMSRYSIGVAEKFNEQYLDKIRGRFYVDCVKKAKQ